MTQKEKAEELVDRLYGCAEINRYEAKRCALVAVDEILFALKYNLDGATSGSVKYWKKVKQEIDKL